MDVSNTVDISDPGEVLMALRSILDARYPGFDFSPVDTLMGDFCRLYGGDFPEYRACETAYHNREHVLDVSLAMARLVDGYDGCCAEEDALGPELALCGIAAALFHDAGYIRRCDDNSCSNGAFYTRTHVSRGVEFMSDYFPTVGLQAILPVCSRIVHFTGYELAPDSVDVGSATEYTLGSLLGSADLIAQMADIKYLDKCRDDLYTEFVLAGIAGEGDLEGYRGIVYRSPQQLLESTPDFIHTVFEERLEGYFKGVHRYAAEYFNGSNLYMDAIDRNRKKLELLLTPVST
jgi:hypothetical protein